MFIWPFGRRELYTAAATPVLQAPPPYEAADNTKMEKEKDYLSRPAPAPQTASYRSRAFRPARRAIAVGLIFMILLCNIQPLFRFMTLPPHTLDGECRHRYPNLKGCQPTTELPESTVSKYGIQPAVQDVVGLAGELVPLEAHIMSKCPDAQDCLVNLIVPAMQRVSDKVNFTLSFIGDVTKDETVHCKHGEDECLGNMLMLCAAKLYPDPKISLGFSTCLIRDYEEIPGRTFVEGCALEHAVDFNKLNKCMSEEGEGLELLKSSIRRSAEKEVQYSCTVRLNDKLRCIRDGGEWVNCEDGSEPGDLIRDIDALYK